MSRPHPPLQPRLLAFAIAMAVVPGAALAQAAATAETCPLGALSCPVVKNNFALCKKNDLLKFYVPGLPTTGNREASPAQVTGDSFTSPDSNVFHLTGNASLERLDQLLRASTLTYNRTTTAYDATGDVRYQERGMLFSATGMYGTTDPEYGVADHVRYQLLTSRGNGVASQAIMLNADRNKFHDVTYSTCDIHQRVWAIQAKTMTMDRDTGVGRAHDVTMRLKGVPFLWLPYLRFPIDHQRQTGFLYPSFGSRSRAGEFISAPFYWNIASNYDATLTPTWFADRGAMLGVQFRYLTPVTLGAFDIDYVPDDKTTGTERNHVTLTNQTNLPWGVQWTTSYNHVSDSAWFQDYGETSATNSQIVQLLGSSSYLTKSTNWWTAGVGADIYQITNPALPNTAAPYRRLPRIYFTGGRPIGGLSGPEWGLDAEAVRFVQSGTGKLGGERFDLYPHLDWPLQGPAWFFRPEVGVRYTAYDLPQAVAPGDPTQPTRTTPIVDADAGLIFERDTHLFGTDYTQTLEPRVYYLYVPYRNQNDLPLFDTQPLTFDFWQLFTTNSFSGADRQMNANNLSLALTTRFLDPDGVEKLSASIGQIEYFAPQKVTLYPNGKAVDYSGSDYVANLTIALTDAWRLTTSQQWNPHTQETDVSSVTLQRRLWGDGIVNFLYSYRRGLLEQAGVSAEVPIGASWKLVGNYLYSLRDKRVIDSFAGVEWDSCCTAVRLVARHFVYDQQGDFSNAIMFEVEFKGLGAYGERTSSFVRNAILGYQE
ncbi:MAG TPA: LPS assembly protein LptD [Rhodanobacteraceae bacterium]|nr:LPS assembly protein LptD [Rhodanobacteraceae bacterium]